MSSVLRRWLRALLVLLAREAEAEETEVEAKEAEGAKGLSSWGLLEDEG